MTTRTVHRFGLYPAVQAPHLTMPPVHVVVALAVFLAVLIGQVVRGPVVVQEVAQHGH